MTTAACRRATAADVPAIVAMLADDHLGAGRADTAATALPRSRAAVAAVDPDPNHPLAVAGIDGAVAGCPQLGFLPGPSRRGPWRGRSESVRVAAGTAAGGWGRR